MLEQERPRPERTGFGPGGFSSDVFSNAADGGNLATVRHALHGEQLPVAGMSVEAVRERFGDRLGIGPASIAILDGNPVDNDTIVRVGQLLEFIRPGGEKG